LAKFARDGILYLRALLAQVGMSKRIWAATFRLLILGIAIVPLGAPFHARAESTNACSLTLATSLPLLRANDRMYVDVSLNGQNARFLLDTGSFATFIEVAAAVRMNLKIEKVDGAAIGVISGDQLVDRVRIDSFRLGGIPVDVGQGILGIHDAGSNGDVAGTLGGDLLSNFDVEIDSAANKINLFMPQECLHGMAYWSPDDYQSVSIRVNRSHHIFVPISLNGKEATALLDTGANNLVGDRFAKHLGIDRKMTASDDVISVYGGNGMPLQASVHAFATLSIDGEEMRNFRIPIAWGMDDIDDKEIDMVLVQEFVARNRLYISYKNRFMAFTLNSESTVKPADDGIARNAASPTPTQ
jgi:predicted aspartyl protease